MSDARWCLPSGDGHVGAPTAVYRDYLEKRLHPAFDEYLATHKWRWSPSSDDSFFPKAFHRKFEGTEGFDPARGTATSWDPALRLKVMDQCGIACEVLNPDDQSSNDPPFGSGLATAAVAGPTGADPFPPEMVRMGARAYNRWLAEFCSADFDRLRGLIVLGTLDDVNWCVDEIHRAFDSGLKTGILLPLEYYLPLYHHPRYDILWQTCVDLGLTVEVHISKGGPAYLGEDPWTERFMWSFESGWFGQRPLWSMIVGGVLERFPTLRLVFTEMGMAWVNPLLEKITNDFTFAMTMNASRDGATRPANLSLTPAEYWARQCFVTHSIGHQRAEFEGKLLDETKNMVWGADLGHAEGIWPYVGLPDRDELWPGAPSGLPIGYQTLDQAVANLTSGLPASRFKAPLTDNFFRAYPNVDRDRLQPTVERVGWTTSQLGFVDEPAGALR